jgi:hypothetical protein
MTRLPTVGVAAIFNNEKPYIVEWLAHHRLLGVEQSGNRNVNGARIRKPGRQPGKRTDGQRDV